MVHFGPIPTYALLGWQALRSLTEVRAPPKELSDVSVSRRSHFISFSIQLSFFPSRRDTRRTILTPPEATNRSGSAMEDAFAKIRYDLRRSKWLQDHSWYQNLGSAVKVGFDEFRHDLRTTRWRRGLYLHSILVWCGGLIATAVIINLSTPLWGNSELFCKPDDSFDMEPSGIWGLGNSYNYWDIAGFFQITLGMGHLDFTTVKVIDVLWDVVSIYSASLIQIKHLTRDV